MKLNDGKFMPVTSSNSSGGPAKFKVNSAAHLFRDGNRLDQYDSFDFSDLTDSDAVSYMFTDATKVQEIDLSQTVATDLYSLSSTFSGCESVKKIKFGKWNLSNCAWVGYLFKDCKNLEEIDMSLLETGSGNQYTIVRDVYNQSTLDYIKTNGERKSILFSKLNKVTVPAFKKTNSFLENILPPNIIKNVDWLGQESYEEGYWYNSNGEQFKATEIPALDHAETYYRTKQK